MSNAPKPKTQLSILLIFLFVFGYNYIKMTNLYKLIKDLRVYQQELKKDPKLSKELNEAIDKNMQILKTRVYLTEKDEQLIREYSFDGGMSPIEAYFRIMYDKPQFVKLITSKNGTDPKVNEVIKKMYQSGHLDLLLRESNFESLKDLIPYLDLETNGKLRSILDRIKKSYDTADPIYKKFDIPKKPKSIEQPRFKPSVKFASSNRTKFDRKQIRSVRHI